MESISNRTTEYFSKGYNKKLGRMISINSFSKCIEMTMENNVYCRNLSQIYITSHLQHPNI